MTTTFPLWRKKFRSCLNHLNHELLVKRITFEPVNISILRASAVLKNQLILAATVSGFGCYLLVQIFWFLTSSGFKLVIGRVGHSSARSVKVSESLNLWHPSTVKISSPLSMLKCLFLKSKSLLHEMLALVFDFCSKCGWLSTVNVCEIDYRIYAHESLM